MRSCTANPGRSVRCFWTIVAEAEVERIDDFFTLEQTLMGNETLRKTMADYHGLVESGRREIYRIENGLISSSEQRSSVEARQVGRQLETQ